MTKLRYLHLRNRFTPENPKIIFILESPPASGLYFYDPEGKTTEPLFKAMMKDVLGIDPKTKEEGLREFAARGYLIMEATYEPVNRLKRRERNKVILRDFDELVADLKKYAGAETNIVLVKANICDLERELLGKNLNVINRGTRIPFPSAGQQSKFAEKIRQVLGQAVVFWQESNPSSARKTMNLIFVTRASVSSVDDLCGRPSNDEYPDAVRNFCDAWNLPYSPDFRCVFVYREGENPDPPGVAINGYGNPFLLNPATVIGDIKIACTQDIQNAAKNGYDIPEIAERNAGRFVDMSNIDPSDTERRLQVLNDLLDRRERRQYVEARIFRVLNSGDIIRKLL